MKISSGQKQFCHFHSSGEVARKIFSVLLIFSLSWMQFIPNGWSVIVVPRDMGEGHPPAKPADDPPPPVNEVAPPQQNFLDPNPISPPVNNTPVAVSQTVFVQEDNSHEIILEGNDSDNNALTYELSGLTQNSNGNYLTQHGRLVRVAGGSNRYQYIPDANFHGTDSFSFSVNDGTENSAAATVTINVESVNDTPIAYDIANLVVDEDHDLIIQPNGTDADSDALTYKIFEQPADGMGTVSLSDDGLHFIYHPPANFNGVVSFTYRVIDSNGVRSNPATINLRVNAVNDAPVITPPVVEPNPNGSRTITLSGADPDGDALTFSIITQPLHGTLNATNDPHVWQYIPEPGYSGPDSFVYQVNDGTENFVQPAVNFNIVAMNRAPVITDRTVQVQEDGQQSVTLNGSDADGDTLHYTIIRGPEHGTLTVDPANPNRYIYTPNENYHGADSFVYRASDGREESADAAVTFNVVSVNDAPTISLPEEFSNLQNRRFLLNQEIHFTLGSSDIDGDHVTFSVEGLPEGASFDPVTGEFRWTPTVAGATVYIRFTASDGQANSSVVYLYGQTSEEANHPPHAEQIADQVVQEGHEFFITVNTSDDDDTYLYLALSGMAGIHYSQSYYSENDVYDFDRIILRVSVDYGNVGPHTVTLKVTDGFGGEHVQTFTLTINPAGNSPQTPFAGQFIIPPNAAHGGADVNVLDWTTDINRSEIVGFRIYRRELGQTDWILIHDNGSSPRFIDQVDPNIVYEYSVRGYNANGQESQTYRLDRSANYDAAYQPLQPHNVLVLVNTNEPGYVNIAEEVEDYQHANGRLDPITEEQLFQYLGISSNDLADLDGDGVAYNAVWHVRKNLSTGRIEIPLAIYYAIRRGIPKENIVFLDHIPTEESPWFNQYYYSQLYIKINDTNYLIPSGAAAMQDARGNTVDFAQLVRLLQDYRSRNIPVWAKITADASNNLSSIQLFESQVDADAKSVQQIFDPYFQINDIHYSLALDIQIFDEAGNPMTADEFLAWRSIRNQDPALDIPPRDIRITTATDNPYLVTRIEFYHRAPFNFDTDLIDPIVEHMRSHNLTTQILSIVSAYHFPVITDAGKSFDDQLNFSLWQRLFGSNRDVSFDAGHHFSRLLGDTGFLAARIDAHDVAEARRMIDDSIWAEENYVFNDPSRRAYIDWAGLGYDSQGAGNDWFIRAADIIGHSGFFGDDWRMPNFTTNNMGFEGNFFTFAPDIRTQMENVFLYMGWYDNPWSFSNLFQFARGAIAWHLDSYSAHTFRESSSQVWGAGIIGHGAAATLGSVNEPQLSGHIRPAEFAHYLLNGYSLAEAAYYADNFNSVHMSSIDGDPLYAPYRIPHQTTTVRIEDLLDANGQKIGERHFLALGSLSFSGQNSFPAYQDYDLNGHLFREQLSNGFQMLHLNGGGAVFYQWHRAPGANVESGYVNDLWIYDAQGRLVNHESVVLRNFDFQNVYDELNVSPDGSILIYRHHRDTGQVEVLDRQGRQYQLDSQTGEVISITRSDYTVHYTWQSRVYTVFPRINYRFDVTSGKIYDSQDRLIGTVTKNSDGVSYTITTNDFTLAHVNADSREKLLAILDEMMNWYVYRGQLVNYLMLRFGMTQQEVESQLSLVLLGEQDIDSPDDLAFRLIQHSGGQDIVYRITFGLGGTPAQKRLEFINEINGTHVFFDEYLKLLYEIAQDGARRDFVYRLDGTCIGYRLTEANGHRVYRTLDGRLIGEQTGDNITVYFGYEDKGTLSLADAIAFAASHDTILVAAGTYTINQALQVNKSVTIQGDTSQGGQVIFDGASHGNRFAEIGLNSEEGIDDDDNFGLIVHFENLALRNFNAHNDQGYLEHGGAIYVAEAELHLSDAILENNSSTRGGAIFMAVTKLVTHNVVFRNNHADENGGAIWAHQAEISLDGTSFENNDAAYLGGAIFARYASLNVAQSQFIENSSGEAGGALYFYGYPDKAFSLALAIFDHVLFAGNISKSGGAIEAAGNLSLDFHRMTFVGNGSTDEDKGIINVSAIAGSVFKMSESILFDNSATDISINSGVTVNIENSLLQSPRAGTNIITGDPLFVDPLNGDFRIRLISPAQTLTGDPAVAWGSEGFEFTQVI